MAFADSISSLVACTPSAGLKVASTPPLMSIPHLISLSPLYVGNGDISVPAVDAENAIQLRAMIRRATIKIPVLLLASCANPPM